MKDDSAEDNYDKLPSDDEDEDEDGTVKGSDIVQPIFLQDDPSIDYDNNE
jgi:hypothetical protein